MTVPTSGFPGSNAISVDAVTAADIQNVTFGSSKAFGRGYDSQEVDAFLEICAAAVEHLRDQLRGQEHDIAQLRERIDKDSRSDEVAHAVSVLSQAQLTADRTVAEADGYSARVMSEARDLYEDTRRKAATLEQETAQKARQVYEDAVSQATNVEEETRERIAQLTLSAATAQEDLDNQTAYLKSLRDTTRTQVELFLESLLNHVSEEFGRAHPMAAEAANTAPRRLAWTNRPAERTNHADIAEQRSIPAQPSGSNSESDRAVNRH